MVYRALADLVALTHFAFILFVVLGGLLALRWRWLPWLHLPTLVWGAAIELFGWYCPLTPLENALRRAGGAAGYPGGFIERYLMPVIYPAELTRQIQLVLAGFLIAVNLAVYLVLWRQRHARRSRGR